MNALEFAAYSACCVLALAAQLTFALREWRSLLRRDPMYIDQLYVRVERYFGLAFRTKLETWLRLASSEVAPGVRVIAREHEEIWVHEALTLPPGARFDAVIAADTLVTGYACHLSREVYTRFDCRIGAHNVLQALACDGDAHLGRGTRVTRWVDAAGEVVLEAECRVLSRVTSARRVTLHPGAIVKSVHAPMLITVSEEEVRLPASARPLASYGEASPERGMELPPRDGGKPETTHEPRVLDDEDATWSQLGATRARRRLADGCIAYDGDLNLPTVTVPSSLVVRGNLAIGAGSALRGDIKARGSIQVGAGTTCAGNIIAGGDVHLGHGVIFRGVIFAEGAVRIGPFVAGIRPDPGVAVYAATIVSLGPGVAVQGKVAAGEHVVVSPRE